LSWFSYYHILCRGNSCNDYHDDYNVSWWWCWVMCVVIRQWIFILSTIHIHRRFWCNSHPPKKLQLIVNRNNRFVCIICVIFLTTFPTFVYSTHVCDNVCVYPLVPSKFTKGHKIYFTWWLWWTMDNMLVWSSAKMFSIVGRYVHSRLVGSFHFAKYVWIEPNSEEYRTVWVIYVSSNNTERYG